jgi:hypothetical protein
LVGASGRGRGREKGKARGERCGRGRIAILFGIE